MKNDFYVSLAITTEIKCPVYDKGILIGHGELCVGVIVEEQEQYSKYKLKYPEYNVLPVIWYEGMYYQDDKWKFTMTQAKIIMNLTKQIKSKITRCGDDLKFKYLITKINQKPVRGSFEDEYKNIF